MYGKGSRTASEAGDFKRSLRHRSQISRTWFARDKGARLSRLTAQQIPAIRAPSPEKRRRHLCVAQGLPHH